MSTPELLEQQIELYANLGLDESWKLHHDEAMLCRNVEDGVTIGLGLLAMLRRRCDRLRKEVDEGSNRISMAESEQLSERFRWWLEQSKAILPAIGECETHRYVVENAAEFRQAIRDVSLMSLDVHRVQKSIASLELGEGTSHQQAIDALRAKLRR